jgi:predicted amidohydrolase YtcJ
MKWVSLLLLFVLPLLLKAQEKVYFNARIFTADRDHPFAEAIAIKGKWIVAVGNYDDVKRSISKNAKQIDLGGSFLMPGFVDSHNHAIGGGADLLKPNTGDKMISVEELLSYAKKELQAKEKMTGDILVIYGLNISTWSALDSLTTVFNANEFATQPLVLRGSDGHTAWCNKAMMERTGIDLNFINSLKPEEKVFYGMSDNKPNGFVSESGYRKISAMFHSDIDYHKASEKAMEYNNSYGITAWLDPTAGSTEKKTQEYLDAYTWLIDSGKLTAHIAATIVADADNDPGTQIAFVKKLQKEYDRDDLSIIGFKIFADGVIEHPTHTAALSLPYTETHSKGVLMFDPEKFASFVTAADKQHLLVHVHAIGDKAVTETLNGFETARRVNGNSGLPHTITHLQIVQPSDFARFKKLNVLASYQLLWAFGDVTTIDIVKPCIDPSLYKWQYPARSMLQAGATICGASDWPVSSADPLEAIYCAETRKGPMGVLDSTQCMPRMEMMYAYTIEAAKALMLEKKIGSLQAGKYADMIVLDRDVLSVPAEEMQAALVQWTMFEGKIVYDGATQKSF